MKQRPVHPLVTRLTNERKLMGLTAREVGNRVGTAQDHIRQLERGIYRPRLDILDAWAQVLDLELTLKPRKA